MSDTVDKAEAWDAATAVPPKAQAEIDKLRAALDRIRTPEAFYVSTSKVDPEAFARMVYAELVLNGWELAEANAEAERRAKDRYPLY